MIDYPFRLFYVPKKQSGSQLNDVVTYYDITIVSSGTLTYYINDEEYVLGAGDAIVIRPGDKRRRVPHGEEDSYYSLNFFDPDRLAPTLPRVINGAYTANVKNLLLLLKSKADDHHAVNREEKISHIISLLMLELLDIVERNRQNPYVTKMLKYISEHFTEKITLSDIADAVSLTPPYCCALAKKELGVSLYDLVIKERIHYAESLLLANEKSLREISDMCGFSDYGYFSKCFKRVTGQLPSHFRKNS